MTSLRKFSQRSIKSHNSRVSHGGDMSGQDDIKEGDNDNENEGIFPEFRSGLSPLKKDLSNPEGGRGYDPAEIIEDAEDEEVAACAIRSVASKADSSKWDTKWSSNFYGLEDEENGGQSRILRSGVRSRRITSIALLLVRDVSKGACV